MQRILVGFLAVFALAGIPSMGAAQDCFGICSARHDECLGIPPITDPPIFLKNGHPTGPTEQEAAACLAAFHECNAGCDALEEVRAMQTKADEFGDFFSELGDLLQKYPAANERFGVFDKRLTAYGTPSTGEASARGALCGPSQCCSKLVNQGGTWMCVECSLCLP
jgi:hypothetical protein